MNECTSEYTLLSCLSVHRVAGGIIWKGWDETGKSPNCSILNRVLMKGRNPPLQRRLGMVVHGLKFTLLLRVKFPGLSKRVSFLPHIECPKSSGNPHSPRRPVLCCSCKVREWPADFQDDLGTTNPFFAPGRETHQNCARGEHVPQWKGPAVGNQKRHCRQVKTNPPGLPPRSPETKGTAEVTSQGVPT